MTGVENAIEAIKEKLELGVRLSELEVREYLNLARDYTLLYMTLETMEGGEVSKAKVRAFNALQNAVERHELMHPDNTGEKGKIVWSVKSTETDVDIVYEDGTIN